MKLCDGKYEFKMDEKGVSLVCLRHGESWRNFVGDNAILALFRHAEDLEKQLEDAIKNAGTIAYLQRDNEL